MTATSIARTEPTGQPVATLDVQPATEADAAAWDAYVAAHADATSCHAWGWRRVFNNAFGHDSIYLIARRDGDIVGVLPLVHVRSAIFGQSLTSMAFLNYGGVLANSEADGRRLVADAGRVAERVGCRHVEMRHMARRFPDLPSRQHKVTMRLALQGGMWELLDRKVRNQIRKAQKSDLTVERGDARLVDEFYTVFARNMRDLGTPVYSPALFREVLREFPDRARLHVVRLGTTPVAAGLTFRTGTTVEVPWASSIREYNTICPNHLLYWSVIEAALVDGVEILDFGRSTPNEGTYRFKEQWGAVPVPLHWEYVLGQGASLPNINPGNPKYSLMIDIWKKLPLPLASALGPRIVRGIP